MTVNNKVVAKPLSIDDRMMSEKGRRKEFLADLQAFIIQMTTLQEELDTVIQKKGFFKEDKDRIEVLVNDYLVASKLIVDQSSRMPHDPLVQSDRNIDALVVAITETLLEAKTRSGILIQSVQQFYGKQDKEALTLLKKSSPTLPIKYN
jgi:hypothetical protein